MWQEKTESMLRLWTTNARLRPRYSRVCHVAHGRILYLHGVIWSRGKLLFGEDSDGTAGIVYCVDLNVKS